MKTICFITALLCLAAVNTAAQKAPAKKSPCDDPQDQHTMNRCAQEDFQKADAELNKVYQQLVPKLEAPHKDKLKIAQRAWVAFRDAHCDCEAFSFDGGSMQPLIFASCKAQATRDRTKQLQALLKEVTGG
jgi:uncharacterized protein YecT (DUF1311 family)